MIPHGNLFVSGYHYIMHFHYTTYRIEPTVGPVPSYTAFKSLFFFWFCTDQGSKSAPNVQASKYILTTIMQVHSPHLHK